MLNANNCKLGFISKGGSFQSHQAAGREDRHRALRGRPQRPPLHGGGAQEAEGPVRQEEAVESRHWTGHQEDAAEELNLQQPKFTPEFASQNLRQKIYIVLFAEILMLLKSTVSGLPCI